MPGVDGLSLMKKLKEDSGAPAIIVLTGKATVETAVDAMKNGAYDYLTKPYKLDELVIVIDRAYEYRRLSVKSKLLEQELVRKEFPFEFVGKSRQIQEILALIMKVAPTDSPVFIQGESGTGKELIANTVWHYSTRKDAPFIALNCATLSENLIESEIFGHEKGAFTSAYQMKHGLVEVADKGTLFLDEIGEMPIGLQPKFLRFLDSGEFRRVGGNKTLRVDVRMIAATNKDLSEPHQERELPRRPVLPPERDQRCHSPAPGAERGHCRARRALPEKIRAETVQVHRGLHRRGTGAAHGIQVARQCAGARERHRAGRDPVRMRPDRRRRPFDLRLIQRSRR